ncbi:hypothetical protein M3J09_011703 [Ascochyta lentis]
MLDESWVLYPIAGPLQKLQVTGPMLSSCRFMSKQSQYHHALVGATNTSMHIAGDLPHTFTASTSFNKALWHHPRSPKKSSEHESAYLQPSAHIHDTLPQSDSLPNSKSSSNKFPHNVELFQLPRPLQ